MTGTQPRRNPVRRLGRAHKGSTPVPDELIRHGVPEIGANAFTVFVLLLSHSDGWETSAVEMNSQLGWGKGRQRVTAALVALQKAGRLVIRDHLTAAGARVRQEYVLHADGRRFTDAERHDWGAPIVLSAQGCTETVQGGAEC